jgi:predicted RNA-binding protein YlxR (DUF448 family)
MAKAEPERSCIVTREVKPKEELIRFVVSPDGVLVPDLSGKLPGRGLYTVCSKLTVIEAIAKKAFNRAAGAPVTIPENLAETVQNQLQRRAADALSLARKAGQVVTGFEKVDETVKRGDAAALIHASDASDDGVRKLRDAEIPVFRELSRDLLNEVLGRENAVHAAVTHGPAAEFFIQSARRFALFIA